MEQPLDRRSFVKRSATLGAVFIVGGKIVTLFDRALGEENLTPEAVDIACVEGENYYDSTRKAVEMLGGMSRFVAKGARVGLLVNSVFTKPGTYAKPQITLAVLAMCSDAGAKEFVSLEDAPGSYWRKAAKTDELSALLDTLKSPGSHTTVEIPKGRKLKKAEILREFLSCDVLINIPIFKDHEGTRFTGVLKNIMGATSSSTNRFFHSGSGSGGGYEDVDFLSQCIADAHLIRTPTLCVADGTELVVTNGPSGPGRIEKPKKVVAGTDPVAIDTFGATIVGRESNGVAMIRMAQEHGLGTMDLQKLRISSVKV